jgi:hypothetical protein
MARRCYQRHPAPAWVTAVMTTHVKALTSATPGDYLAGSARITVFPITKRGHSPPGRFPCRRE